MKNMLIITFIMLAMSGCEYESKSEDARRLAVLHSYQCTAEQLDLVNTEYSICVKSSWFSSVCYASAKESQCTKINVQNEQLKDGE